MNPQLIAQMLAGLQLGDQRGPPTFPGHYPLVYNKDGTVSNVKLGTFGSDMGTHVLPTMINGLQMEGNKAPFEMARSFGLENYPTFTGENQLQEAIAFSKAQHGNVSPNGYLRGQ